jgi:formylglycine-generating enzyme required for sulfatase activity
VEITRPFYLGVSAVTQEEYQRVMGGNPSYFAPSGGGSGKVGGVDTRHAPVEQVSWQDAVEFCRRLAELPEEKRLGQSYRLPTEAEWEYACRGGHLFNQSVPFYLDQPSQSISSRQANFNGNAPHSGGAKGPFLERTTPVGSYPANALGLIDMHGNVWEWCADWFDPGYYQVSPKRDPSGPPNSSNNNRVLRGGSWLYSGQYLRAAYRGRNEPGNRSDGIGFRVVLALPPAGW